MYLFISVSQRLFITNGHQKGRLGQSLLIIIHHHYTQHSLSIIIFAFDRLSEIVVFPQPFYIHVFCISPRTVLFYRIHLWDEFAQTIL
jgi:hypothetical protein